MTEPTAPAIVAIVGGSRSDLPTLEAAVGVLDELGVHSELRIVSAHRTPDRLFRYAEEAAGRGIKVIVAGGRRRGPPARDAGRQDALAGHRRAHHDPAPWWARFAALDRPDAAWRPGRDRGHRQCDERRAPRGGDPGPLR